MDLLLSEECSRTIEAEHRLANRLQMIGSYIERERRHEIAAGRPTDALDRIRGHLQSVALCESLLRRYGGENLSPAEHMGRVCAALEEAIVEPRGLELDFECSIVSPVSGRTVEALCLILAEALTNAAKHGTEREDRPVRVRAYETDPESAVLEIVSSIGSAPSATGTGQGLRIMEALACKVGGCLTIRALPSSFSAKVSFPLG